MKCIMTVLAHAKRLAIALAAFLLAACSQDLETLGQVQVTIDPTCDGRIAAESAAAFGAPCAEYRSGKDFAHLTFARKPGGDIEFTADGVTGKEAQLAAAQARVSVVAELVKLKIVAPEIAKVLMGVFGDKGAVSGLPGLFGPGPPPPAEPTP